jgi:hypothetical protein
MEDAGMEVDLFQGSALPPAAIGVLPSPPQIIPKGPKVIERNAIACLTCRQAKARTTLLSALRSSIDIQTGQM